MKKNIFHIGKGLLVFLLMLSLFNFVLEPKVSSQSCYNITIDTLIKKITMDSITQFMHEFTGDVPCTVGGNLVTISTRAYNFPGNDIAAQYIFERFSSYGLNPYYFQFSATGKDVVGTKIGTKYPNQKYIICAHYDSYPWEARSIGADDNATGTCAVLQAAKFLSTLNFDYTLQFISMDEEERGLFGSEAFADTSFAHGDSIVAVLNFDMTAFDRDGDRKTNIITNIQSIYFANVFYSAANIYVPTLVPVIENSPMSGGSDSYSFWQKGYRAIWPFEKDVNPYVNSIRDSISNFNFKYFLCMTKAAVAAFATLGKDYLIDFNHTPLTSTTDTSSRIATFLIHSHNTLGTGGNTPKLYFKINESVFNSIDAFYSNADTFKFQLPGATHNTKITYYVAAQDIPGNLVGTFPPGGRGVNPPGTISPPYPIVYYITSNYSICSTKPVEVPKMSWIRDSIYIPQNYLISDVNVNLTIMHQNDTDLVISLYNPAGSPVKLSYRNGGFGANYINTTFDDEATDSIKNGIAPFTGSYIPEEKLSLYDNQISRGTWWLRVINVSDTTSAILNNWCLNIDYIIGVKNIQTQIPTKNSLSQNYPNPFNPVTNFKFQLASNKYVKLEIYDILGRKIQTIVNQNIRPGTYEIQWDANNYSSGIYFYSLYLDGNLFETKKMVLMK